MNPILLKPTADKSAQVILNGRVHGNMTAMEYHTFKPRARDLVRGAYEELARSFDVIVIEGAGSPAEINLRENDLVNMGMAEIADAPVLLVGDIDRGGVFASLAGTLLLLDEKEKERVKGVIINKFRGDVDILKPGLSMLEGIIGKPVLGVVPWLSLGLEDEDSVTERLRSSRGGGDISIEVIRLPRISNFTDFDIFRVFPDVSLKFVDSPGAMEDPDLIIIPGTKNTIGDMKFLRESGLERKILEHHRQGKPVIGICGGYQMMGRTISDPHGMESAEGSIPGLGLLPVDTVMEKEKITEQARGTVTAGTGLLAGLEGLELTGYEIHMGVTHGAPAGITFLETARGSCGITAGNAMGTYLHGIFDSHEFTRGLMNNIRRAKGLQAREDSFSYREYRENEFNRLAHALRQSLDMEKIYRILDRND